MALSRDFHPACTCELVYLDDMIRTEDHGETTGKVVNMEITDGEERLWVMIMELTKIMVSGMN